MERSRFARLCAGIERLTVGQMRELRRRLREVERKVSPSRDGSPSGRPDPSREP